LIVIVCVGIKGLLSFSGPLGIDRCFLRDIEFDIRNDLLKRLMLLEPEFYVRNRTGRIDVARATKTI